MHFRTMGFATFPTKHCIKHPSESHDINIDCAEERPKFVWSLLELLDERLNPNFHQFCRGHDLLLDSNVDEGLSFFPFKATRTTLESLWWENQQLHRTLYTSWKFLFFFTSFSSLKRFISLFQNIQKTSIPATTVYTKEQWTLVHLTCRRIS